MTASVLLKSFVRFRCCSLHHAFVKTCTFTCLLIACSFQLVHANNTSQHLQSADSEILSLSSEKLMQIEIDYLLNFVKNTNCQYERNGDKHSGVNAAKHIKKKYDYYEDDIESTEQFIELSASKSTMSGKSYTIHCPNEPSISSQQWLLEALKAFRISNSIKVKS